MSTEIAVGPSTSPRLKTRFSSLERSQRRKIHFETSLVDVEIHLETGISTFFVDECHSDGDESNLEAALNNVLFVSVPVGGVSRIYVANRYSNHHKPYLSRFAHTRAVLNSFKDSFSSVARSDKIIVTTHSQPPPPVGEIGVAFYLCGGCCFLEKQNNSKRWSTFAF